MQKRVKTRSKVSFNEHVLLELNAIKNCSWVEIPLGGATTIFSHSVQ